MTTLPDARERLIDAAQRLIMERGYNATTVDAIIAAAGSSKGAFFHHFASKAELGRYLVERYARADIEVFDGLMAIAESRATDPGEQLVEFVKAFEEGIENASLSQPACLFVSFIYEQFPGQEDTRAVIMSDIVYWRTQLLRKLEQAVALRPLPIPVDLESLADQVFTTIEGGFILARATGDPLKLRDQLRQLRWYLTLLLLAT